MPHDPEEDRNARETDEKQTLMVLRAQVVAALIALASLITLGTLIFHRIEDWSWAESFYFTIVTLATVGYGDLHPSTDGSRVFTAIFIILGASIALASLSIIGARYLELRGQRLESRRKKKRTKKKTSG